MSYLPYSVASGAAYQPIILVAKNLPLKVGGATGDLGTINLPIGLNRYRLSWGTATAVGGMTTILEYATGFMDHGLIGLYSAPSGGPGTFGAPYVAPFAPPTTPGFVNNGGVNSALMVVSGQQLYICQTQASTSTVVPTGSFYICAWPIP